MTVRGKNTHRQMLIFKGLKIVNNGLDWLNQKICMNKENSQFLDI